MTCVLRVTAPGIEQVLDRIDIKPYRLEKDTAHFDVSKADFDQLAASVEDAMAFLRRHRADIDTLMSVPSSDGILDFGTANRDFPAQYRRFPAELVCMAGKAGLGLELSFYMIAESKGTEA